MKPVTKFAMNLSVVVKRRLRMFAFSTCKRDAKTTRVRKIVVCVSKCALTISSPCR